MSEKDPSALLISFLTNFSQLFEKELSAIHENVVATVETVMQGIEEISETVERKRRDAEEVLEFTYLNPDLETEVLIEDIQKVADETFDRIFNEVHQLNGATASKSAEPDVLVQNQINRFGVKLDGQMKQFNELDDRLTQKVFEIVGVLSTEDLISQRLEHIILSMKSLQTGLSYILIDYEHRCREEEIEKVIHSILDYVYRQYTTEEQKRLFTDVFGKIA